MSIDDDYSPVRPPEDPTSVDLPRFVMFPEDALGLRAEWVVYDTAETYTGMPVPRVVNRHDYAPDAAEELMVLNRLDKKGRLT